jgi:methionine synthase II (cobalamin-independent)
MPGTDPVEATKLVFGELDRLAFLPELPGRGPGAGMVGRAAAVLVDTPVDLQPSGWRLVPRPGLDLRRARDLLARDLDVLGEVAAGYGGAIKVAVAGPWTLASSVELPRGHKALSDAGAIRDLAQALAAGLADHVADVSRRLPAARVVVQVDEPLLPAVLAGHIRTPSGFSALPAVEPGVAGERLRAVLASARAAGAAVVGVHCCAPDVPLGLLRRAGADFAGVDATLLTPAGDDAVGEAVEAGLALILGVVPSVDVELSDVRRTVEPVVSLWRRLGFPPETLAGAVAVSPTCGLAGASEGYARAALRRCVQAGSALADAPE